MSKPKIKRLAPKGAADASAAAAIMRSRFDRPEDPAAEAPEAATEEAPARPRTRPDAEGMTKRTYYLSEVDADALEATVDRLHDAVKGLAPKHRILGAIISRGLGEAEAIESELKNELIAGLTGGE